MFSLVRKWQNLQDQCGMGEECCLDPTLLSAEGVSPELVRNVYSAAANLHRANPWKIIPVDPFIVTVTTNEICWEGQKPPFSCASLSGGSQQGFEPQLQAFRSVADALSWHHLRGAAENEEDSTQRASHVRLAYSHRDVVSLGDLKMIQDLDLEVADEDALPEIDMVGGSGEDIQYEPAKLPTRKPTLQELQWLRVCLVALTFAVPQLSASGGKSLDKSSSVRVSVPLPESGKSTHVQVSYPAG